MTEKERAISELQGYLRNLSRTDSDIERVVPDGIFGEETERSVRSFQRKYGLPEDGIVSYEVWTRIREENDRAVFLFSEPRQVARISDADLPLSIGMRSNVVYHLKTMLLFLSQRHDNFSSVTVSDVFDAETESSVRQWQRVIRVPDNGIVDKVTWNALADYYLTT
ncbi:MAG: peptidoglycan-binding protein [Acutalibacteraceae bacterium]|nr:peptidoglycan-binding protein [Acutalibacteraceae bacterium]